MTRKRFVFVLLIFAVRGWSGEILASPARRTGALQSFGALRKCEEIYYSDNGKYTENIYDLMPYTNITNTLKDIKNSAVHIEVSSDYYTITAKPQVRCDMRTPITATPYSLVAGESEKVSAKEEMECLKNEWLKQVKERSLVWAKCGLFLLFGFFMSYISGDKKYTIFKICLLGLLIYLILDFLTPNFY